MCTTPVRTPTFASCKRTTDITLEYAFIFGVAGLGCISIGAGFVKEKIILIVLRALTGIGACLLRPASAMNTAHGSLNAAASMTIPSALTLLVNVFPESKEQARAWHFLQPINLPFMLTPLI